MCEREPEKIRERKTESVFGDLQRYESYSGRYRSRKGTTEKRVTAAFQERQQRSNSEPGEKRENKKRDSH